MICSFLFATALIGAYGEAFYSQEGEVAEVWQLSQAGDAQQQLFSLHVPPTLKIKQLISNSQFIAIFFERSGGWDLNIYQRLSGKQVNRMAGTGNCFAKWMPDGGLAVYPDAIVTVKPLPEHELGGPFIATYRFEDLKNRIEDEEALLTFLNRAFTKYTLALRHEYTGYPTLSDGSLVGEKYAYILHFDEERRRNVFSLINRADLSLAFTLENGEQRGISFTEQWIAFSDSRGRLRVFTYQGAKIAEFKIGLT